MSQDDQPKREWEPPEAKLPFSKSHMNNKKRLTMKARRLVQSRYGKDVEDTRPRSEYLALLASAKLEIQTAEGDVDERVIRAKPKRSQIEGLKAGKVDQLPAQPKGHAVRKILTVSVKESVIEVFHNMGGVDGYTRWAERNPDKFYDHWAKLLPIEMKTTLEVNTNISTILQQARMRVANLREVKGERLGGDIDNGYSGSAVDNMVADAEGVVSEQ